MTEPSAGSAPVYVGFWPRFLAFLADSTVASLALSPLVLLVLGEINMDDYDLSDPISLQLLLIRLSTQMAFDMTILGIIFVLFWIFRSATPGKMLFSAVIVDADTLEATTKGALIVRYLGYFIALIPFGLGFLWIAWDKRKQGWHDKLANTVVIKAPRKASSKNKDQN